MADDFGAGFGPECYCRAEPYAHRHLEPAADDRARVPGEDGDEDRTQARRALLLMDADRPLTYDETVMVEQVAYVRAAERSRAEEKRAALVKALEGLADFVRDAGDSSSPARGGVYRDIERRIRAVLDEHR